ncbi:tudor domain-containing protein 7-like [Ischnura elegans]|uniref:tudor domain-containing protein 7-like n=1 Tax=Ischnura elegans TaxID=197161 RepID=UPI001ED87AB0|nr:tudor domain-containing protein 7-like [Ischnura elegans]
MDANQVIDDIRSCLISSKGGVPISQINRDYKMIVGHAIPYTKLGYTTLENFLKAIPGLNVYPKGGDLVLEALPTKNTSHITAMVRGQKSSGPKRKTAAPSYGMRNLKGFRTGFSTPLRKVTPEPVEKTKRPAPTPPHMTSMPRANLPPRLKALATQPPKTAPPPTLARLPDAAGSRKGPDVPLNLAAMPLFKPESTISNHHVSGPGGDAANIISPTAEPHIFGSSVLRTPTGVLGRKSPAGVPEYRRHTSEELTTTPIMTIHFPSLIPPRTSAQSRISRQVSLPPLSLDNDVKMTPLSPPSYSYAADIKPVPSPSNLAGNKTGGYCQLLEVYCKAKNLHEPEYKIIERFPKSKTKQIVCSIKVGPDHQFSSYPAECRTEEEAKEVAAQEAVGSLERIYGVLGESLPITTDENVLVARIAQMVHDHPNGLWSLQLPADYRKLFREILPEGWLDIVRTSPLISIDLAVHDRIILLPNRSSSSSSNKEHRTSSSSPIDLSRLSMTNSPDWKTELERGGHDNVTNGETADLSNVGVTSLGNIKLPEDEYWNVYVSYATSTSNIWIRLIGDEYSTLYDDIAAEMEMFYMDGGAVAQSLVPGHFYAIQVDKCWHRVEIIELLEDEESNVKGTKFASCFFVDNGDDDTIEVTKFRILDARFTKLSCQAVQCRLTGLDDFSPEVVEDLLLEKIIGHNFVAKPAPGSLEDEVDGRPYPSLTLYDTSTDENVNLNEVLLERIISETVPPTLLKNGKIQEAYVSYIEKNGAFFIQVPSNTFDYVAKAIDEFSANIAEDGDFSGGKIAAGVTAVFEDMIYLAKFQEDMLWYRAVKDAGTLSLEYGKVWVKFVDYGNCELTSMKDLVLLPPTHPLARLPSQAIECRLHNMPMDVQFTEKGLKRCREILPPEDPVLLKVSSTSTDSAGRKCDVVEIFKRVLPDNLLASVSTTLSVEDDVFERAVFPGFENGEGIKSPSKSAKASSKMLSDPGKPRTLPAPKVPKVGELFDVHVTIAANPGNFTVQPWKDAGVFSNLMSSIQAVYSDSSMDFRPISPEAAAVYRKPLKRSHLHEGGVYAALHDDQLWYRISISKLIEGPSPDEVMVSAYFVDYGDIAVMTLDKLRELAPEFCTIPYQAIKAKLAGVRPVHSDWSVEDCLRFQEMVCNKQFVSTIVETGPDLIDPSETVIGLHLTDTSDPKVDASIGQIFVDEGRAEFC